MKKDEQNLKIVAHQEKSIRQQGMINQKEQSLEQSHQDLMRDACTLIMVKHLILI